MERDRWQQMITVGVVVSLAVAIVGIGIGIKALRKTSTPPTTVPAALVVFPFSGATVSGTTQFNATAQSSTVTAVDFVATGGSLHGTQIATSRLTVAGWLGKWDTSTVSNGTYKVSALAYDGSGKSAQSPAVPITVKN
jgi:chitinase